MPDDPARLLRVRPTRRSEVFVPLIRPFRALRYRPESVPDLSPVVSPPYDVISPELQRRLLARHPRNVVRLDLPTDEPGDAPDERYRRAARALAQWRSDGTLRKDARPALYAYEQTYRAPDGSERVQRGFFGRLRLEPLGPDTGVRPHERTLAAAREDRYRLLRATGVNTSPVVGLYEDPSGTAARLLADIAARPADVDVIDDDGVRHRLWAVVEEGTGADVVAQLTGVAGAGAITIADGHHRYETALRYRDERRMSRSCEEDPAFDYLLALLVDAGSEPLTVLPTHRLVALGEPGGATSVVARAADLFDVRAVDRAAVEAFGTDPESGGRGRFGLWTRDGGFELIARREAFDALLPAAGAVRELDVTLLAVAIERLAGIDRERQGSGDGRIGFTKSASEALARVDDPDDPFDLAFLVEPTPVRAVLEVAGEGDVMPQKSTYFHPKPLTGLVINPHEW